MIKSFFTIVSLLFLTQAVAQKNIRSNGPTQDTFSIYFDLNISSLNKRAKDRIDSLIYLDKLIPGSKIMIIGYADYLGSEGHNQKLSEDRAKNVEDYLLDYNFHKENITICIGKGEVERKVRPKGLKGYPTDRKVDIAIVRKKAPGKKGKPLMAKNTGPTKAPAPNGTGTPVANAPQLPKLKRGVTDLSNSKAGETIRLSNLYFLPQRHTMTKESIPELENLFEVMVANPKMKIRIEGHVCCIKDYPDAMDVDNGDNRLSVNRAKAVFDFLEEKGISKDRMKYIGFGKSKPIIVDEETEEDANINRRVEIRIIEK